MIPLENDFIINEKFSLSFSVVIKIIDFSLNLKSTFSLPNKTVFVKDFFLNA